MKIVKPTLASDAEALLLRMMPQLICTSARDMEGKRAWA